MENLKIDSETAQLVVQAYQKTNKLKDILNSEPYFQVRELLESGTILSNMLSNAFDESAHKKMKTKLTMLSVHLKKLISQSNSLQNIQNSDEVNDLFNLLSADISSLQSKLNEKK